MEPIAGGVACWYPKSANYRVLHISWFNSETYDTRNCPKRLINGNLRDERRRIPHREDKTKAHHASSVSDKHRPKISL